MPVNIKVWKIRHRKNEESELMWNYYDGHEFINILDQIHTLTNLTLTYCESFASSVRTSFICWHCGAHTAEKCTTTRWLKIQIQIIMRNAFSLYNKDVNKNIGKPMDAPWIKSIAKWLFSTCIIFKWICMKNDNNS